MILHLKSHGSSLICVFPDDFSSLLLQIHYQLPSSGRGSFHLAISQGLKNSHGSTVRNREISVVNNEFFRRFWVVDHPKELCYTLSFCCGICFFCLKKVWKVFPVSQRP